MEEDKFYSIALSMAGGVGPVIARELIRFAGSAKKIFETSDRKLSKINGVGTKTIASLRSSFLLSQAEQEYIFTLKNNINIIDWKDEKYPRRLKRCNDSPIILYHKGNAFPDSRYVISIVGSRQATDYGKNICKEIIRVVKDFDPLIISGLAYGIDITSHKEALKQGLKTIGVVGHGLDRIYPAAHKSIALQMLEQGGLLTEFFSGVKPDKMNFPARNRIIAGLSDAVIVVEAREQGGALITAGIANSYNRDVFAFPGKIYDSQSKGCLYLIKNNIAQMIIDIDELPTLLGWDVKRSSKVQRKLFIDLDPVEIQIINLIIQKAPVSIDDLSMSLNWPLSKLAAVLLDLELSGMIIALPGKRYELC